MKKTLKFSVLFILLLLFSLFILKPSEVIATSTDRFVGEVKLGGDTIGIQLKTKVEVVGKYEVTTKDGKVKPWNKSNILEGDYIYSINDNIINNNDELNELVRSTTDNNLDLVLIRDDEMINTQIEVVKNANDVNSIGLYIKDHLSGIGTLTFINLKNNKYGALGHSVSDSLSTGKLYESSVRGIKKAIKGVPGEKFATLSPTEIGTIEKNNDIGIFGEYNKKNDNEIVNVVKSSYVHKGNAQIVTVLEGNIIKKYDIKIIEVEKQNSSNVKGIKFKVIDEELINTSGGIIQGMSGSPIIQDGNLIGAVSHVVVNDPLIGFGVFAEWMYYETL